jgi:hypothetical protein
VVISEKVAFELVAKIYEAAGKCTILDRRFNPNRLPKGVKPFGGDATDVY